MKGKVSMVKRVAAVCVAMVLGLFGLAMLASPAQAQGDPAFEQGIPTVSVKVADNCEYATLAFYNPTPWLFVFDVRVDGEASLNGSVAPGVGIEEGPLAGQPFGPRWTLVEVDGREGIHRVKETFSFTDTLEVRLAEGAEQKLYFDWTVLLRCVTPETPELSPATCDTLAQLAIPTQKGVVYSPAEGGPVGDGTHQVTAEPADGYVFPKGADHAWDFTVNPEPGCPGPTGPPGEDGEDGQGGAVVQEASQKLPNTGNSYLTGLISVGIGLLATGAAAVGFSRFRGVRS